MEGISSKYPFVGFIESRIGGRKENQDFFGYVDTPLGLLLLVCDGMGGGPGGRTASTLAVSSILDTIKDCSERTKPQDALRYSIEKANEALYMKASEEPELRGMGTTVVALLINEKNACIAHVGDSRLYQIRRGKVVFRTADHSFVAEQVRLGRLTEEQARNHPRSNQITRALGIRPTVEIEFDEVAYKAADRFVLCSDGIWGSMPEPRLIEAFSRRMGLSDLTAKMAKEVDDLGESIGGGHDNLTLAILDTTGKSQNGGKKNLFAFLSAMKIPAFSWKILSLILALVVVALLASHFVDFGTEDPVAEVKVKKGPTETTVGKVNGAQPSDTSKTQGVAQTPGSEESAESDLGIAPSNVEEQKDESIYGIANKISEQERKKSIENVNKRIDEISKDLDDLMQTNIKEKNSQNTDINRTQNEKKRLQEIALKKAKNLKTILKGKDEEIGQICVFISNSITVDTKKDTPLPDRSKGQIIKIKNLLKALKQQ